MEEVLGLLLTVTLYIVGTVFLAAWLGIIVGIYQVNREASFRRRAIKLLSKEGEAEEFLILSGNSTLVKQLYSVVIATTARTKQLQEEADNKPKEGIALDGTDQTKANDTN